MEHSGAAAAVGHATMRVTREERQPFVTLLAQLVHERGLSYESAARDLEDFARRERIDATISSRHLQRLARRERLDASGHAPARPGTRMLLSRYFGRAFDELLAPRVGLPDPSQSLTPDQTIADLASITDADVADAIDEPGVWTPDLASRIIAGHLLSGPAPDRSEPLTGSTAATRIRDFATTLAELDFRYGGGFTRLPLLHFFRDEVIPCLNSAHSEAVRREVFGAATDVVQVLGWAAYDIGRHQAAGYYFRYGLRLAREAGDRAQGARLLGDLSHQANFLGRSDEAVQYARAAQYTAVGATRAVRASLYATEARALAVQGESTACASALSRAETELSRSDPSSEPGWIGYFDAVELAGESAYCFRDLDQTALAEESVSLAINPDRTPLRTRAFLELVSASVSLQSDDLDKALALGNSALGLISTLQSHRARAYAAAFHHQLVAAHPRHPEVLAYSERMAGLSAQ
ncbi:MAG: hypothetical protein ACRCYQ_08495 [Nocardioides sp.]